MDIIKYVKDMIYIYIEITIDMDRYQKGKIYKIANNGYNKCYLGSTCEELSQRMARHRRRYKAYLNEADVHCSSFHLFDEFGVENCKIELIEDHPCSNKEELLKQEGIIFNVMNVKISE